MNDYTAPTDRQDMRGQIVRMYFETVTAAADLENWMLNPVGQRPGTFRAKFTPFHSSFLRLYICTRCICMFKDNDDLKTRIDEWIERCEGNIGCALMHRDVLIKAGLKLFEDWSKKLFDQSILEFR